MVMVGTGIPDVQLIDNSSERLPLLLIVDGSGSMQGAPIAALNDGLRLLEKELKEDPVARLRVQLLVLQIGGNDEVTILTDWTDAMNFTAPEVVAYGSTPLGKAVRLALTKLEDQKHKYKNHGIPYKRPWLYIVTDGSPTDTGWEAAGEECRRATADRKVVPFAILTGEAQVETMRRFADSVLQLQGVKFRELFQWLSASASAGSKAQSDTSVQVPVPPQVLTIPT
jgi:uncharacterized protein YegL